MSKNCGIYYIQNTKTNQLYIGQSIDLNRRKREHIHNLKSNSHVNTHLQNSFNKYGESFFKFDVIEYCDPSDLDDLEKKYMALFNVQNTGFNICDGGIHVCPDNSNENHGMWRDDISNDLIKELYLKEYTSEEIADLLNCSRRTINRRLKKIFDQNTLNKLKKKKHINGAKSTVLPIDELINLYVNKEFTLNQLTKKYNSSKPTIRKKLKQHLGSEYDKIKYNRRNIKIPIEELEKLKNNEILIDDLSAKYYCDPEDINNLIKEKPSNIKKKKNSQLVLEIPLDELKELYLQDWEIKELAKNYSCDRHTISRRLKLVLGENYSEKRIQLKQEKILKLARENYNSMEIASMLNCTPSTVINNLQKIMTKEELAKFKRRNRSRKMKEIYQKYYTQESKQKRANSMKKYTLWDGSKVHFNKKTYAHKGFDYPYHNPLKSFYLRYNGRDVKVGENFIEFLSPTIIHNLIKEFSE